MKKRPNYLNPPSKWKHPSREELLKAIHEVHERNEIAKAERWIATQNALHNGPVCGPAWVHRAMQMKRKKK